MYDVLLVSVAVAAFLMTSTDKIMKKLWREEGSVTLLLEYPTVFENKKHKRKPQAEESKVNINMDLPKGMSTTEVDYYTHLMKRDNNPEVFDSSDIGEYPL